MLHGYTMCKHEEETRELQGGQELAWEKSRQLFVNLRRMSIARNWLFLSSENETEPSDVSAKKDGGKPEEREWHVGVMSLYVERWKKKDCFSPSEETKPNLFMVVTWLILPVVICLSQRLSHACLSINKFIRWNCEWLIISVIVYLIVPYYMDNRSNSRANTC